MPGTDAGGDSREMLIPELIRAEMLRAGTDACGDSQSVEIEVRSGRCWARHRAILRRYDLPTPIVRDAIRPPGESSSPQT